MDEDYEATIFLMHTLIADLLAMCAAAGRGDVERADFNDAVKAAADAVIKVQQARVVQLRREMGMEGDGESN